MNSFRPILLGLVLSFLLFFQVSNAKVNIQDVWKANVRNTGLYNSSWPIDHADSARNKFGVNTGFQIPENSTGMLSEDNFKVESIQVVALPQWFAMRNSDEIYQMAGSRDSPAVAKINTTSMELSQVAYLNRSLYIGGLSVIRSGHVFAVIGNQLHRFWQGDLNNVTVLDLPGIDGGLEQTNGMIVTNDEKIIIKTWCWTFPDWKFFFSAVPVHVITFQVAGAAGLVVFMIKSGFAQGWFQKDAKPVPMRRRVMKGLTGFVIAATVVIFAALAVLFGILCYLEGNFSTHEVIFGTWREKFSRISVVDPHTMEVLNCVNLTFDRVTIARMALVADSRHPGVDNLITLGDEFVIKWNYFHENHSLVLDEDWTERYRFLDDGSFPGTGPTIINDVAYFTDNTFPVRLGPGYRMYKKALHPVSTSNVAGKNKHHYEPMQTIFINQPNQPGFMFWSPVFVPLPKTEQGGCVLVWDTSGRTVQCRTLDNLDLVWEVKANNSDCVSASVWVNPEGSKTLVYFADYDKAPETAALWMRVTGIDTYYYKNTTKYLMVVDGANGEIQAKIPVVTGDSVIYPSMIIPGPNHDVFMSGRSTFIRVSQVQK